MIYPHTLHIIFSFHNAQAHIHTNTLDITQPLPQDTTNRYRAKGKEYSTSTPSHPKGLLRLFLCASALSALSALGTLQTLFTGTAFELGLELDPFFLEAAIFVLVVVLCSLYAIDTAARVLEVSVGIDAIGVAMLFPGRLFVRGAGGRSGRRVFVLA